METLDYKLAVFIERIYNATSVGPNSIAKELELPYSVFQSRINQLNNLGFSFRGFIDSLRLRLKEVYVIGENDPPLYLKEVKFVRNMSALIPKGGFYVFYIPIDVDTTTFLRSVDEFYNIGIKKTMEVIYKELKKASMLRYRWSIKSDNDMYKIEEWRKIIDDYVNIAENSLDSTSLVQNYFATLKRMLRYKRLPLDSICLSVLKELERDPLRRIKDVAEDVKTPFKKALKCVRMIVNMGIYKGTRLRKTPWSKYTDMFVIAIIKAKNMNEAVALVEATVRFPLNAGASISTNNRVILVFRVNNRSYAVFKQFLNEIEHELGFDIEWFGASPLSMVKRFTIPYKQGFEYSKYKKGWLSSL